MVQPKKSIIYFSIVCALIYHSLQEWIQICSEWITDEYCRECMHDLPLYPQTLPPSIHWNFYLRVWFWVWSFHSAHSVFTFCRVMAIGNFITLTSTILSWVLLDQTSYFLIHLEISSWVIQLFQNYSYLVIIKFILRKL